MTMDCFWDCCQIDVITGGWGWCGLVYSGTQLYLFYQHLQYSMIIDIDITITDTGVNMNLILPEDQEILGADWSFIKVILGILVAMAYNL